MKLDFAQLYPNELTEFLEMYHRTVPPGYRQMVMSAGELFEAIEQNPNSIYPVPVVDLFIASQFVQEGRELEKDYSDADLGEMNEEQLLDLGRSLGLDPSEPTEVRFIDRLDRIITIIKELRDGSNLIGIIRDVNPTLTAPIEVPDAVEVPLEVKVPDVTTTWVCPIAVAEGDTRPMNWGYFDIPSPNPLVSEELPEKELPEEELPEEELPEGGDFSSYEEIICIGDGNCFFHAFLRGVDDLYIGSYAHRETITEEELKEYEQRAKFRFRFAKTTLTPVRTALTMRKRDQVYQINNQRLFNNNMNSFRMSYACAFRQQLARYIQANESAHELILRLFPEAYVIFKDEVMVDHPDYDEVKVEQVTMRNLINYYTSRIGDKNRSIEPDILILISEFYNYDIYVISNNKLHNPNADHPFPDRDLLEVIRGPQDIRVAPSTMSEEKAKEYLEQPNRPAIVLIFIGGVEGHYNLIVRVDYINGTKEIISRFDSDEPLIQRLYDYAVAYRHTE